MFKRVSDEIKQKKILITLKEIENQKSKLFVLFLQMKINMRFYCYGKRMIFFLEHAYECSIIYY
jgi:hypothetical protein